MDILIVDDEKSIRDTTTIALEDEGHYAETATDGRVALMKLKEDHFDLVLLDMHLGDENGLDVLQQIHKMYPKLPVVVFTAHATVKAAVEGMRRGALDFLEKPFSPDQLRAVLARAQKFRKLEVRIEELETEVTKQGPVLEFETKDPAMREIYDVLFRAADTSATMLVLGESGTGKSVVARAVHERSPYRGKPFVTVSCPSLSKELLESELFGHIKGSFTGAIKDQWGKVKVAEGGTLFLDEIGELPMEIQPKLLRLLQEREYERLGENKTRTASLRVIAATNRDLHDQVKKGLFREDLYYRLNVITVDMPPLRSRPADLTYFANRYLEFFAKEFGRPVERFTPGAMEAIRQYEWPGNLRELKNALERAVILSRGTEVSVEDLPVGPGTGRANAAPGSRASFMLGDHVTIHELEREHILRIIDSTKNLTEAANVLGIDQATLYRKRKRMSQEKSASKETDDEESESRNREPESVMSEFSMPHA